MVADALTAIQNKQMLHLSYPIRNIHRSIGARVSGEIARQHGADGLPEGCLTFKFNGSAGQSFGVWNAKGLTLELEGDANDYVGKGMAGGRIVIYPPKVSPLRATNPSLSVTPAYMAQPVVSCLRLGWLANALGYAILARWR